MRTAITVTLLLGAGLLVLAGCGEPCSRERHKAPQARQAPCPDLAQDSPADTAQTLHAPRAVVNLALPTAETSPFLTEQSFVTTWTVLGPFQFEGQDLGGEQYQGAADREFIANEGTLDPTRAAPEGTQWQYRQFRGGVQAGQVNLNQLYGGIDYAAAYAVAWLDSPQTIENARIYLGSDDYIKVWVNGKLLHTYNAQRRGSDWDQDVIQNVTLRQGLNHVVVKCVDVVDGWDFYFRLTDENDMPITARPVAQPQP